MLSECHKHGLSDSQDAVLLSHFGGEVASRCDMYGYNSALGARSLFYILKCALDRERLLLDGP